MAISTQDIKKVLIHQGVEYLYHANYVVTSLSFLRLGGLLSRGYAEDLGVPQTPQQTDEKDKMLGIYYDVFFDALDVHSYLETVNYYGPVSFVYSVDVLDCPGLVVKITKDNPIRWERGTSEKRRYFTSEEELKNFYNCFDISMHITICDMRTPLRFGNYLKGIVIEDPQIDNTSYLDRALEAIQDEAEKQGIDVPIHVRKCSEGCACHSQYRNAKEGFTYHRFKTKIE